VPKQTPRAITQVDFLPMRHRRVSLRRDLVDRRGFPWVQTGSDK
jgi:hypothetical protein